MDTPKRNENQQHQQSGTPTASKVEDSPVFNFINSLSPIKPVRPVHIAQTIHTLSFPSIPSIFTSPHINMKKDSKLLARYPLSDLSSKSEYLDGDGDQNDSSVGAENAVEHSNQVDNSQDEGNLVCSLNEANNNPPDENSTLSTPQLESFHYDCGSPSHNLPSFDVNSGTKYAIGSTSLIEFVHDGLEKSSELLSEFEFRNSLTNEQQSELKEHDWETAIFEGEEDLLFLDSSDLQASGSQFENYIDHEICCSSLSSRFSQNITDNIPTTHIDVSFPQNASTELVVSHTQEFTEKNLPGHTPHILSGCSYQTVVSNPTEKIDAGSGGCNTSDGMVDFQQQRGTRRRCLTFEMAENRRRNFPNDSNRAIPSLPHLGKFAADGKQTTSSRPRIGLLSCSLPTIGLHLNSLTSTPKDGVLEDSLFSAKTLGASVSPHPLHPCGMRNLDDSLSMEKSPESDVENLLVVQDGAHVHDVLKSDDLSHSSPKKKKQKAEISNDGESTCRRCNCKKSKCLKLYCECFATGVYCIEPCSCQGCLNTSQHEDTVLATRKQIESRNPLAFAPKVIRASEPAPEVGEDTNKTPASARHKRGCNCKKSSCLKKYCECYQGGAGCSISCRCEGCKNTFGRKDGTMTMEIDEIDPEEGDQERHEADMEKMDNQKIASVQNEQKHFSESLPITPSFQTSRRCFKLPSTSTGKPPRHSSSGAAIGSTTLLSTSKILVQSNKVRIENAISEIRQGNASPISGVKIVSPSRKRISSPRIEGGSSPSHKGCRKLILKSIPSFPSLTGDSSDELNASSSPSTFNS